MFFFNYKLDRLVFELFGVFDFLDVVVFVSMLWILVDEILKSGVLVNIIWFVGFVWIIFLLLVIW